MINSLDEIKALCRGKRFCLVGNATSILKAEKDIDAFDIIGRMNRGAPRGKEKFIGSRTDILFLSTRLEVAVIAKEFKPKFVVWMTIDSWLASEWVRNYAILNPWKDWCELYLRIDAKPTTGLMAINFLLKHVEFKDLTIYGFDFFQTPTWYNSQPGYRGPHDAKRDKEAVLGLIEGRQNVRLINEA
jgi:hypothetical protein